ncbi:MAG TPA: cysteine--tRNA ligase [Armatimonadetes bacterium]|nr:cysteine--tRNA ligase [Armatimonadota bacterium]
MALHVFNTLHRRRERFEPLDPPKVRMYVCGPTVYGHSHIGHAKSYLSFDLMVRWLRYSGYEVTYVQNITDVGHLTDDADEGEDKIIAEARRRGLHPMAIAELFTTSYLADMDALGLQRPDIQPRATGHIPEQIAMAETLLARGHAYEVNGSVYYDVHSFDDYGQLSGRRLDEVESGARVAVLEEKRDPRDFALWKAAEPGHIMRWPSPWGVGYPGWHLECSAMSVKYLGESFDIHGGGLENQFPHHECEIAQSEGATGHPFVRYWLHNHMITVNGEKMGKSKGNFILIKEIIDPTWPTHPVVERKYDPLVLRLYVLNSHYRSDLDFTPAGLDAAEAGLRRLHTAVDLLRRARARAGDDGADHGLDLDGYRARFAAAMDEDFGSPGALAVLFDYARATNELLARGTKLSAAALDALHQVYVDLGDTVLGLIPETLPTAGGDLEDGLMELLLTMRREARIARNFALADQIRDQLTELGVTLEDTRDGTTWRRG